MSPVELTDRFHSGHSGDDNGDFIKIDCPAIYEREMCEGPLGARRKMTAPRDLIMLIISVVLRGEMI